MAGLPYLLTSSPVPTQTSRKSTFFTGFYNQ